MSIKNAKDMTAKTGEMKSAPWNTHKENEPALRSLAQSIKDVGMMHRIVCRKAGDGTLEVIDGHRRLAAAKLAKMAEVPVTVCEATDEEAMTMTATANAQRLENDPVLEARLVKRLMDAGNSRRKIAAVLGWDEGKVGRRVRILALTPGWLEEYDRAETKPDAAQLELIARYSEALQDRTLERVRGQRDDDGNSVFDEMLVEASDFNTLELDDDEVPFDTDGCRGCERCTACTDYLFPDMAEETPRCMDAECFDRRWNEAIDSALARLRKRGVEVCEAKTKWDVPRYWEISKTESVKTPVPWIYEDNFKRRHVCWSVEPEKPAKSAKTAEEKAKEREEKRTAKLVRSAREKMRGAIRERLADVDRFIMTGGEDFDRLAVRRLGRELSRGWHGDDFIDDFATVYAGVMDALTIEERNAYGAAVAAR